MNSKEIKIGTITEWLAEDLKVANRIIEKNINVNIDYNWFDDEIDYFIETSEKLGFDIDKDKVNFSGFHSQGDGASFEAYINILIYLKATKQLTKYRSLVNAINSGKVEDCTLVSRNSHFYSHEKTCSVNSIEVYDDISDKVSELLKDLEEELEEKREDLCVELYRNLENYYEYLRSRECIIYTLSSNEYEFDENSFETMVGRWEIETK